MTVDVPIGAVTPQFLDYLDENFQAVTDRFNRPGDEDAVDKNLAYNPLSFAAFRALTTRPLVVTHDGSLWGWYDGDATPANSTATAAGTILECVSGAGGRYKRLFVGDVYFSWFGTVGDGVEVDNTALEAAATAAVAVDRAVSGRKGDIYGFNGPLNFPFGVTVRNAAFKLLNPNASATLQAIPFAVANDAVVTGSIAADVLTVTGTTSGAIAVGQRIRGLGVRNNTMVLADLGGGTWRVSRSQTVASTTITGFVPAEAPKFYNVSIDRNGLPSDAGSGATTVYLYGADNVVMDGVEVFGDGKGKLFDFEYCVNGKVIRAYLHDAAWSDVVNPGTEQIWGMFGAGLLDFEITGHVIKNLTGTVLGVPQIGPATSYQNTDGLSFGGCENVTISNGITSNVGEGIDVTGSLINYNVWVYGDIYLDCAAFGQKWVHGAYDCGSVGCRSYRAGYAGCTISAGPLLAPQNVTIDDFQSFETGSSGLWQGTVDVAGFVMLGNVVPITNIQFVNCTAISTTQEYGFRLGGVAAAECRIVNPKISGATVADFDAVTANMLRFTAAGRASITGGLTVASGGIIIDAGGLIITSGNTLLPAGSTLTWDTDITLVPGNDVLTIRNPGDTLGVRLDFSTDDVLRILNRTGGANDATLRSAFGIHDTSLRVGSGSAAVNTLDVTGSVGTGVPVTKTADFTLAASENDVINNKAGSTCVVTLPAASSWPGRIVWFKNTQAQALNSNASNVVPLGGGVAAPAILSANAGRWARLKSDGTNWVIMAGVI